MSASAAGLVRVAVAQAAPATLDLETTLDRLDNWTARAAAERAVLVAFPETWIPGYPAWVDVSPGTALWDHAGAKDVHARLLANAVEVPGPAAARIAAAARDHAVTLVVGVHERVGRSLYNTILIHGPDGRLLNRHRKLIPTHGERLVWAQGDGSGLRVVETPAGRVGALVCWEHWMPLARQALHVGREDIHVALWPGVKEMHHVASRHYAFEGRCFVLAAGAILASHDLPAELPPEGSVASAGPLLLRGGSAIIGPDGAFLAGPVFDEEALLLADLDLEQIARESLTLDVAGHYSRPDVFSFAVRGAAAATDPHTPAPKTES